MNEVKFSHKKNPASYFAKSPRIFSHQYDRFEEVAKNGSQKVLWNMLNNLSRDWYWMLCREFGVKAHNIVANYFPVTFNPNSSADCSIYAFGEFPHREIDYITVRYNLSCIRHYPEHIYFNTIPHEMCHAICHEVYNNDIEKVAHGKEWQEMMEFIGVDFSTGFKFPDLDTQNLAMNYTEPVMEQIARSYPDEKWI